MTLTSKERVRIALNHEKPDRVPIHSTYNLGTKNMLMEHFGESDEIGLVMGNDMVRIACGRTFETGYNRPEDEFVDAFGVRWKAIDHGTGKYTEVVERPLAGANRDKMESWNPPDPFEESQYAPLRHMLEKYGKDYFIVGSLQNTLFETAWALRGMDALFEDMIEDEDYTDILLDKIMHFPLNAGLYAIRQGVDMIFLGDDVGTQLDMLLSPNLFRKYLKPRFAYMIQEYKKENPNIKMAYHSCGNPSRIIDDLVEVGFDVLNPLQPKALDPYAIRERYGKNLALWGGLDIQEIMPKGSPEDVRKEVKKLIDGLGRDGGYIIAPAHYIQDDTPLENILAFYETAKSYGNNK